MTMPAPAPAPGVPVDPYANAGAEGNIDRQKALLNDIIAAQGQRGRQIYEGQPAEAQQALQAQLASAPATGEARKAVFDAYINDAKLAQQGHTEFTQRQSQLNSNFLDQAKAAVPIHAADLKNQQEALRMQFEDAKAAREAAAADRAASRASSGPKTTDQMVAEALQKLEVTNRVKAEALKGVPPGDWTMTDARAAGLAGGKMNLTDAAISLGMDHNWVKKLQPQETKALNAIQSFIDNLVDEDVSFNAAQSQAQQAYDMGLFNENSDPLNPYQPTRDLLKLALQQNSTRWGTNASSGNDRGSTYRPY
jgi:hypothetical protein